MNVAEAEGFFFLDTNILIYAHDKAEPDKQLSEETGYHFYDALIVAAAVESGCRTLYSEDLQHGRKIGNLTILNPFAG